MIKSMTGFGRANSTNDAKGNFSIEMKSINHRYLDLNIRIPRSMMSLEEKVRKHISEKIKRGKIDVFINYASTEKQSVKASFNKVLGDSYFKCLQEIKERYDVKDDISVSSISGFADVIYIEEANQDDMEELWGIIVPALEASVDMLIGMREREGSKLKEDIIKKCDIIKEDVKHIEKKAPKLVSEYKHKLKDRIRDLLEDKMLDETRLNQEIAMFADKSSIDEEITRLYSHVSQVLDTLKMNEPVGRKLDFIVQEMNREANTIASKATDLEVTNRALNIKNEIEKIREQIQNIE